MDLYGLIRFGRFRPWNDWQSFHEHIVRSHFERIFVAEPNPTSKYLLDQGAGPRCAAGRRTCTEYSEAHLVATNQGFQARRKAATYAPT